MSELHRRAFLTTAPAAALAATLPTPEPEAQEEENEYPHATGFNGEAGRPARQALPEELHLLRCLIAASKAIDKVLNKHGPGCDDLAECMVCHDAKAARYAISTACDMISGDLLGTAKLMMERFNDE